MNNNFVFLRKYLSIFYYIDINIYLYFIRGNIT